ncbi:hypothetical protein LTR65_008600 [Meristemomyces frigidus]
MYEVQKLNVLSSTQISSRTKAIISHLTGDRGTGEKPVIVSIKARAMVAGKLVSIIEIAKRELAAKGVNCFQYTALTSELVDIPRKAKRTTKDGQSILPEAREDDSEDGFETMGAPNGATKQRNMPVMTVHLSRTPVRELKARYGEQA